MGVQLFAGKYFKVRANVFQDNQKPIPKYQKETKKRTENQNPNQK